MDISSLAFLFAPLVLRPKDKEVAFSPTQQLRCSSCIQYLIENNEKLFPTPFSPFPSSSSSSLQPPTSPSSYISDYAITSPSSSRAAMCASPPLREISAELLSEWDAATTRVSSMSVASSHNRFQDLPMSPVTGSTESPLFPLSPLIERDGADDSATPTPTPDDYEETVPPKKHLTLSTSEPSFPSFSTNKPIATTMTPPPPSTSSTTTSTPAPPPPPPSRRSNSRNSASSSATSPSISSPISPLSPTFEPHAPPPPPASTKNLVISPGFRPPTQRGSGFKSPILSPTLASVDPPPFDTDSEMLPISLLSTRQSSTPSSTSTSTSPTPNVSLPSPLVRDGSFTKTGRLATKWPPPPEASPATSASFFPPSTTTNTKIGRAVQQECRDRSRMPSSA
eukprot:TRINITY_DN5830_c0_g2_i1.p1 TRINITY_DN5830_c0_g2~~TRINITY_DN5830_c0_g2_i1.p1  ORF type:complete len:462 (-),score=33.04 TRINITY_DN5830_c0_g2_i1:23-1207(-)